MLDTAGLTPSAEGTRVHWEGGKTSVTDRPFTESKEVVGGYAIMQCQDKAEGGCPRLCFSSREGPIWLVRSGTNPDGRRGRYPRSSARSSTWTP
jgi:hypothetical protein